MTPLDLVVLRRADEQVANLRLVQHWERDSWDVPAARRPPRKKSRARCLAGDCDERPVAFGYCRRHIGKVRAGVALDIYVVDKRPKARRSA